jgi:glycosyltransferase involved in cell wall biosynthesis
LKQEIKGKGLSKYFVWKGFVSNQEDIYNNVDVVLVPSLSEEPCSMTIIEAMMQSKAVIVSDRGGNTELTKHNQTGLVFEAGNAFGLSTHMEYVLLNQKVISEFGKNAHTTAIELYTVSCMVDKYETLYNNLLMSRNC